MAHSIGSPANQPSHVCFHADLQQITLSSSCPEARSMQTAHCTHKNARLLPRRPPANHPLQLMFKISKARRMQTAHRTHKNARLPPRRPPAGRPRSPRPAPRPGRSGRSCRCRGGSRRQRGLLVTCALRRRVRTLQGRQGRGPGVCVGLEPTTARWHHSWQHHWLIEVDNFSHLSAEATSSKKPGVGRGSRTATCTARQSVVRTGHATKMAWHP